MSEVSKRDLIRWETEETIAAINAAIRDEYLFGEYVHNPFMADFSEFKKLKQSPLEWARDNGWEPGKMVFLDDDAYKATLKNYHINWAKYPLVPYKAEPFTKIELKNAKKIASKIDGLGLDIPFNTFPVHKYPLTKKRLEAIPYFMEYLQSEISLQVLDKHDELDEYQYSTRRHYAAIVLFESGHFSYLHEDAGTMSPNPEKTHQFRKIIDVKYTDDFDYGDGAKHMYHRIAISRKTVKDTNRYNIITTGVPHNLRYDTCLVYNLDPKNTNKIVVCFNVGVNYSD